MYVLYIYTYINMYVCMYMYTERERERERDIDICSTCARSSAVAGHGGRERRDQTKTS